MTSRLAGTGQLLRLYLRLDRFRLSVWILAILVVVWASVDALQDTLSDPESLQARAILGANPASIMMTGPLFTDNYNFGTMVANELSLWLLLPTAIMAVLFTVRHTRTDEESGRLEMLRALPHGRLAATAATTVLVVLASSALGAATTIGLLIPGMAVADSVAFGLAVAVTGLVFGAATAVAAQLTSSAGTATGLGMSAIVLAFLIRGVGDVIDKEGSWLSWFSPFAWAQQTRLYSDLRWWPLLISLAVAVGLTVLALRLADSRDLGAGIGTDRPGPAEAATRLLSPEGLAYRMETPKYLLWGVGLLFFAVAFGSLASELDGVLDDVPALNEWVEIDLSDLTTSFGSLVLSYLSLGPAVLLVTSVLRLRREEREGRLTALLLSGFSRPRVLAGWFAVAAVEAVLLMVVLGAGLGLGMVFGSGGGGWSGEMALASLAYVPTVLLHGAISALLLGWLPRLAALSWLVVSWSALVLFLGQLLRLPDWAMALSPLWHAPLVPEAKPDPVPLAVLAALTVAFLALGLLGFRRRDIAEG
ncbi:polyketide antibiotic transporter [Corynebacterium sp. YIM 101645]|uniref:Polyketide antibiotic transporter n=1 Tax=Corynebacterium lemuris TaxID=1859292 RepID=A0ABT2FVP5_9CORY|nr:polyketide antibiotic transporter [Corynebacterium lemuris]